MKRIFPTTRQLQDVYARAKQRYAALGADTDQALATLSQISLYEAAELSKRS